MPKVFIEDYSGKTETRWEKGAFAQCSPEGILQLGNAQLIVQNIEVRRIRMSRRDSDELLGGDGLDRDET